MDMQCHSPGWEQGHWFFSKKETAQIGDVQESEEKLIPNTEVTPPLQEKVLIWTL